ncbi:hypothetical protein T484DRAFT_1745763 [Baffinella frigidus]|nr:hypothetical protein T484DRAFT_1745763 [Cryptophyta sp. CCMP2293]
MPQPTSAAQPLRSNYPPSPAAMRSRSAAHDALWSLASSLSEDACDDRSCRSNSSSSSSVAVAPFKLPSVSLSFLRPLRSADDRNAASTFKLPSTTKQPNDDVFRQPKKCPRDRDLAAMLKWLDDTEGFKAGRT